MRLAVNATAYGDPPGGAGLRARHLLGALKGFDLLFLLAEDTPETVVPPGAEVRRLPVRASAPLRRWLTLDLPDDGDVLLTDHYPALARPPTILTLHDCGRPFRRALVRRHLARAAAVVAVSETVRRAWDVEASVVPNGVAVPDEMPPAGDHLLVVDPAKGGCPGIRSAGREVREVGRGRAWIPQEALFREMARAAAVLVPSRGEGFGMVALEAMALGRPVVVPDLGAFREVLSRHAFYVGEGGWGAAATRALAAPAEHLAAARAHARGFTWERAAEALARVIEVVTRRPACTRGT
ncbi:MAG TPA: glycosyltransferase [Planctomycetota bacterium]|nr:glycosyltransferase [Planctomycetota bacterium]